MSNKSMYLYGIVKNVNNLDWKVQGIEGDTVFMLTEGVLSAIVRKLGEEPYLSKDAIKVREQIIMHNKVLDKAMEDFGGVVPLKFGTIIVSKNGKSSSENLKGWLKEDGKRLERMWELTKGKKEYGIRIYYQKKQLVSEVEKTSELIKIKSDIEEKSTGTAYLLKGKLKSQTAELVHEKIGQFKNDFYELLTKITENVRINRSKLVINEKDDLLLNLSVLVREEEMRPIMECLEKQATNGFSYQLVGPFAPYSFVENGN